MPATVLSMRTLRPLILLTATALAGCSVLRLSEPVNRKAGDWTTFGLTGQHVAVVETPLAPPLKLVWDEDIQAGVGSGGPLIVGGIVVLGTQRGELVALDAQTGRRIGATSLGDAIDGSPVIDGNTAIVGLSNTRESLVAFNMLEAKLEWKHPCGDIESSPALFDKKVYIGNVEGDFFCVGRYTGDQIWKYSLPSNTAYKGIRSSPAIAESTVVFGADDGAVYALDARRGSLLWRTTTGSPVMASPSIRGDHVYIGNLAGTVSCLSFGSGAVRWQAVLDGGIYATATPVDSLIVIGTTGGTMYGLRSDDGTIAWKIPAGGPVNTQAVAVDGTLYVGTLKHMLIALRASDGTEVWKLEVSGRVKTSPSVVDNRLYLVTDEKDLLCFGSEPHR